MEVCSSIKAKVSTPKRMVRGKRFMQSGLLSGVEPTKMRMNAFFGYEL
jgi:hypothetical protein